MLGIVLAYLYAFAAFSDDGSVWSTLYSMLLGLRSATIPVQSRWKWYAVTELEGTDS